MFLKFPFIYLFLRVSGVDQLDARKNFPIQEEI